jgi:hypothetical protein
MIVPSVDVKNDFPVVAAGAWPMAAAPASRDAVTPIPVAIICPGVNGMTRLVPVTWPAAFPHFNHVVPGAQAAE